MKKTRVIQKAWVDFSEQEKEAFKENILSVSWKNEGIRGPVFVIFKQKEKSFFGDEINISRNYKDSNFASSSGHKYAQWFTLSQAKKIAKELKVELNEV